MGGLPVAPPESSEIPSAASACPPHAKRPPEMPGAFASLRAPIRRGAVVVVNLAAALAVRPVPGLVLGVMRRALELLFADIDLVAAELRIVGEQRPRQRVIVLADAQEADEAHHRVGDLAADL